MKFLIRISYVVSMNIYLVYDEIYLFCFYFFFLVFSCYGFLEYLRLFALIRVGHDL